MKYPLFNWNTIPTFIHMCNQSGPFNETTNKFLSTFPIVTIEKCQGVYSNNSLPLNYSSQYEESKILEACENVKKINKSVTCIIYLNSILDFNNYYLHIEMINNPSYKLLDDNGVIVYQTGAPGLVPEPPNGYWVFDYQQEIVQNLFISECINATKSKFIDGCFIDRSQREPNGFSGNYTFSNATNEKYKIGHNNVLYEIQKQLNDSNQSISITKVNTTQGIAAVQIDGFTASTNSLDELIKLSNAGIVVEAHIHAQKGNDCENIINSLACFLIGAQKFSYYGCSKGWTIDGWLNKNQYHKILGEPVGNAVLNGKEWNRKFNGNGKNMTLVKWDTNTLVGTIYWSDGTVQIGIKGSPI